MRGFAITVACGLASTLFACGFEVTGAPTTDGPIDTQPPPPDIPEPPATRVSDGLVGLWTFDDAAGSRLLADTSGATPPIPLEVVVGGSIAEPMLVNGNLVATTPGRIHSALNTRLPREPAMAGAVTLEMWVQPNAAVQGTSLEPSFVGGLAANVASRNIAFLQAGGTWIGLVRTTAAIDGTPALRSSTLASTTKMTHLVLVASPTQRVLYVDNTIEDTGIAGGPLAWDLSYPMALIDEFQHARQWTGSLALVALYRRALTPDEVRQNFAAGHSPGT